MSNLMPSVMNTATYSGPSNRGLQLASNSGQVLVNFHGQTEPSPTKPQPSSTVPFRRDPDFVDRGILAEIGEKCSEPASRVALVGLGGVGKSQLAIEYSYRITEQFPQTWIFWIHASNAARFEEGYRMIADRVELPRRDEPKVDILHLVSKWLCDKANGQWIMILDNADDSAVFSDPRKGSVSDTGDLVAGAVSLSAFLPQSPNGSILVTSRSIETASRLIGRHHDIIKVKPMNENHALLLFQKRLQGAFDESDTTELLRALDYMPLAISQAAAYINQGAPRTTVARYLDQFRKSDRNQANLLNRDVGDLRKDSQASNSIITTWQLSFEYIYSKKPSAARLLSLMSFFDRQGIPEFLLRCYDDRDDDSDLDLKNDSDMKFEDDVSTLIGFSLIMTNVKENQFEMHQLVQFSTRKWLELSSELETWQNKYIKVVSDAFPNGDYETWTNCRMLYPHAAAILACRPTEMKYLVYWSEVLHKAGWYALLQGNYLKAEEMNRRALEEREKRLGKEHHHTLESVTNLASVLQKLGKYEAAEEMCRQALEDSEKALGKEHPDTLTTVSNLASVLQDLGKYEAAEEMCRQALEGNEKALGKEHPDTLASVNNLASVLLKLGKYEAAEEMCRQALQGREKALGKEHPVTLSSFSNLASILQHLGKYEAAEEMHRQVLEGREKALGNEHPQTLKSVYWLAHVLHRQKQYKDATALYERSYAGFQEVLGVNHPRTLACFGDYSSMIEEMKLDESLDGKDRRSRRRSLSSSSSLSSSRRRKRRNLQ